MQSGYQEDSANEIDYFLCRYYLQFRAQQYKYRWKSFLVVYKAEFFFILCRHPLHLLGNHRVVRLVRQVYRSFQCLKLLDSIEFINKKNISKQVSLFW